MTRIFQDDGTHVPVTVLSGPVGSDRVQSTAPVAFEVVARNALGEETQSTPAIANGRIYFRTVKHVIAIGGK